mmetsp:Transcript_15586/g.35720  ORF Transcript_15586/g.35720 Transcript_15586/m.35720 type:complete len:311 (-) Transcript_15586:1233-2165(-)
MATTESTEQVGRRLQILRVAGQQRRSQFTKRPRWHVAITCFARQNKGAMITALLRFLRCSALTRCLLHFLLLLLLLSTANVVFLCGRTHNGTFLAGRTAIGVTIFKAGRSREPSINASRVKGVIAGQHSKSIPVHKSFQANDADILFVFLGLDNDLTLILWFRSDSGTNVRLECPNKHPTPRFRRLFRSSRTCCCCRRRPCRSRRLLTILSIRDCGKLINGFNIQVTTGVALHSNDIHLCNDVVQAGRRNFIGVEFLGRLMCVVGFGFLGGGIAQKRGRALALVGVLWLLLLTGFIKVLIVFIFIRDGRE